MSDRQTTGGYTKIAVVSTWSVAQLAQKMPGDTVRFHRVTEKEATEYLVKFEKDLRRLDEMRASYRSR
jgi:allophanate hydrolase subunit 2